MRRPGGFDRHEADAEVEAKAEAKLEGEAEAEAPRSNRAQGPRRGARSKRTPGAGEKSPRKAPGEQAVPDEKPGTRPEGSERGSTDRVRSAERDLARARRSVRKREKRETRRFTAHLRRRRRNWLIGAGAVVALAVFVAVGTLSPLMAVRTVEVVGASRVSVEKLETALGRFEGTPLTLVRDAEVHTALEPFPLIQRYSIERIPPHTLLVRIEERDPVIAIERDGAFEMLDPAGVLVAQSDERPSGVPLAAGSVADPASAAFAAAGVVIRDLPSDLRKQTVGVEASSAQDVELTLADGTRVVWGEAVEIQRKAVVLRAMLKSVPQANVIDVSAPDAPVFE